MAELRDHPATGADMAAFVVNPSATPVNYGVSGSFELWNGSSWRPAGAWLTSLDFWGGSGSVGRNDDEISVPAIGLSAEGHAIGPGEYFSVPPLRAGWYRVAQLPRGPSPLYGVFRVAEDAPKPPPITATNRSGLLLATPSLLGTTGGDVRLVGSVPPTPTQTAEEHQQFNARFAPEVVVDRWTEGRWKRATTLPVHPSTEPKHNHQEVAITLPPLRPDAYRLSRHHAEAGDLTRTIGVADLP